MSEPADRDDDLAADQSAEWLVAYDAALLSGINQVGMPRCCHSPTTARDLLKTSPAWNCCTGCCARRRSRAGFHAGQRNSSPTRRQRTATKYLNKIGRFEVLRELGRGGYGIVLLGGRPAS